MTDETMELLREKLARKLHLEDPDEDTLELLEDELLDAEAEILLELNMDTLEERFYSKCVELAAVFYRSDLSQEGGLASWNYAEGQVNESETYLSPGEYQKQYQQIMDSLKRYRRVTC